MIDKSGGSDSAVLSVQINTPADAKYIGIIDSNTQKVPIEECPLSYYRPTTFIKKDSAWIDRSEYASGKSPGITATIEGSVLKIQGRYYCLMYIRVHII